jgi:uroporphyrinogen decarboxylase
MTIDDPQLVEDLFEAVGSRLVRYYEHVSPHETVGAVMANDDWGFKSQPMLSPDQMRGYVIPWHARIVEAIHATGKPALLHSCGNLETVMDDIIDVCGYDAKHSWEDNIMPVEQAWERWHERIAVLGGMDVDFVTRGEPQAIKERARAILQQTACQGYALGTGNSVPEYVPDENYLAMVSAAHEMR